MLKTVDVGTSEKSLSIAIIGFVNPGQHQGCTGICPIDATWPIGPLHQSTNPGIGPI